MKQTPKIIRPRAAEILRNYRNNILHYVNTQFKVTPDKWQEKALIEYSRPDKAISRISLQACAGPGKTAVLAWCGLWFLCTQGHRGEHPKGAVVAKTLDNLKDNIWPEFSKWINVSPLCRAILKWTKTRIFAKDHNETWFLSARSFSRDANSEDQGKTLSGVHSQYVTFILDESGEIPISVLKAAEQTMSVKNKKFARILQAGNPTSVTNMLYHASKLDGWFIISITGDPEDPYRSPRIDIKWAQDQIDKYGRTDPWVMAYILGQFPESGINTLLSLKDVEDSMRRVPKPNFVNTASKRLGVDVARFGLDSTVIFPRQGLRAYNFVEMRKRETDVIAARVALAKQRWGSHLEFVDGTGGWGAGVVDSLRQARYNPREVHFSGAPIDQKYKNKRSEMWFEMANWVKRGGMLPMGQKIKRELTEITYSYMGGKFIMEDKEQLKKRLGYSPDIADALALTFAMPESEAPPTELPEVLRNRSHDGWDYDPLNR